MMVKRNDQQHESGDKSLVTNKNLVMNKSLDDRVG